jgi:hypothetical protein
VVARDGKAVSIMGFTVAGGKVVAIDTLADPERLAGVDQSELDG